MPSRPINHAILDMTLIILVLTATAATYWPGLFGGFIFDDFPNIVRNDVLKGANFTTDSLLAAALSSDSGPLARPLSSFTFALQIAATGLSPFVLKLGNLLIHLVNGLLAFLLIRKLRDITHPQPDHRAGRAAWILFPVLVSAAWLLAPINLTGVLYVVQRMESLSTLFMLLGLLAYIKGRLLLNQDRPRSLTWMAGGLAVCTLLGVLAKETAVMLPAYAFVIEWVLFGFRSPTKQHDRRVLWLFAVLLFLPGLLGLAATLPGALSGHAFASRSFTLAERLWTEGRVLIDYLAWILLPDHNALSLYHDDYLLSTGWMSPPATFFSLIALIGLLTLALWLRQRRPLIALGLLFYFTGHSLVSTYLPLELIFEHRNYLPSLGALLALFALLLLEPVRINLRTARVLAAAGLVLFYGFLTHLRANEWSSPLRLAYAEATRHPLSPRANYELGKVLADTAPDSDSIQMDLALQNLRYAAHLPGTSLLPLQAIILIQAKRGQPIHQNTWDKVHQAVSTRLLSGQDTNSLYSLIDCLIRENCHFNPEPLGEILASAVEHNPRHSLVLILYANYALNVIHDLPLGLSLTQRALALNPKNIQYWKNLVTLQTVLGQLDEARAGIERLRELDRFGVHNRTIEQLRQAIDDNAAELQASTGQKP